MNIFNPEISVQATDIGPFRTYRIGFFMPGGEGFTVRGMSGSSLTVSPTEALSVIVDSVGEELAVKVMAGSTAMQIGTIKIQQGFFAGYDITVAGLREAIERAFFIAMGSLSPVLVPIASSANAPSAVRNLSAPSRIKGAIRRLTTKRVAIVFVLFIGIGAVAYGTFMPNKVNVTQANSATDYAELTKKIQAQIVEAANSSEPVAGLDGANVAVSTMKAMGLDPGKANAGCLVGVK